MTTEHASADTRGNPSRRVAFVTGASRGLGAAIAVALAGRGFRPVLAVRDPALADSVRASIAESGADPLVVACDVGDASSVRRAVDETLAACGRLDVVVNNAGRIDPIGHAADVDAHDWEATIDVNLVGPFRVVQAALPALLDARGVIVNISTGAAHTPREGWTAYCSSKAGLAMLTRCLGGEYGARGVATYGFAPGLVDTDMQTRIRGSGMNEISRVPKDQLAPPERAAGIVAWLADARPADLVGQDLTINDQALVARTGLFA